MFSPMLSQVSVMASDVPLVSMVVVVVHVVVEIPLVVVVVLNLKESFEQQVSDPNQSLKLPLSLFSTINLNAKITPYSNVHTANCI